MFPRAELEQVRLGLRVTCRAARLLASGPLRRSARRAGLAVAATTLLVLAIAPVLLVVSVLLKLF